MGDTHELRLPDGRTMAYAEHGDPTGRVVLACVGTPDSRLTGRMFAATADELGVRVLVPDRPGFGRSDPLPGRTLTDWPADAAALLDRLGVSGFAVVGGSGGGPYAVACGVLLAERVSAVGLVAPAAPRDAPAHGFVPLAEAALRERGERFIRLLDEGPDAVLAMLAPDESDADRTRHAELDDAEKAFFFDNLREALRQGSDAYVEDHTIVAGDWADLLPRLTRPTRIWQGDDDNNVPDAATRWLAGRIPGAELTVLPGSGHDIGDAAWAEVFRWVLAR